MKDGHIAFDDEGHPALACDAPAHDEFAEILDVLQSWPVADRLRLFDALGLSPEAEITGPLRRAFAQGVEVGKACGMRELLAVIFRGATTAAQVGENAAVVAVAQEFPDAPAKTIRELASFAALSTGSACNRVNRFRSSGPTLPKLNTLLPDFIGENEGPMNTPALIDDAIAT
jgi:hypothetical protein